MLTLLETTNAINALDTEKDVIRNACEQVLYGPMKAKLTSDANSTVIAQDMALTYGKIIDDKQELLVAFIEAAAFTGAFLCKPGHEITLLESCFALLRNNFIRCRVQTMAKLYADKPDEAISALGALIKQAQEKGPKED